MYDAADSSTVESSRINHCLDDAKTTGSVFIEVLHTENLDDRMLNSLVLARNPPWSRPRTKIMWLPPHSAPLGCALIRTRDTFALARKRISRYIVKRRTGLIRQCSRYGAWAVQSLWPDTSSSQNPRDVVFSMINFDFIGLCWTLSDSVGFRWWRKFVSLNSHNYRPHKMTSSCDTKLLGTTFSFHGSAVFHLRNLTPKSIHTFYLRQKEREGTLVERKLRRNKPRGHTIHARKLRSEPGPGNGQTLGPSVSWPTLYSRN